MYRHSLSNRAFFTEASYTSTPNIFDNDIHWANPMNLDSDEEEDGLPHTFVSAASFYSTTSSKGGVVLLVGDIVSIDEGIHRQLLSMHNHVNSDTLHCVLNEYMVTETGSRVEVKNCILDQMQVRLPTEKVRLLQRKGSPVSKPYRARSNSFSSQDHSPVTTFFAMDELEDMGSPPQQGQRLRLSSTDTCEESPPQQRALHVHTLSELEEQLHGSCTTRTRQGSLTRQQMLNFSGTSTSWGDEGGWSSDNIIHAPRHMSARDLLNPDTGGANEAEKAKSLKTSRSFVDRLFGTHRKSSLGKSPTLTNNQSIPEPCSDDEDYGNETHPLDEEKDFGGKSKPRAIPTKDSPESHSMRKRSFFSPSSWRKGSLQNMIESLNIHSLASAGKRASFRLSPRVSKKNIVEKVISKFDLNHASAANESGTTTDDGVKNAKNNINSIESPKSVCIA